MSESNKNVSSNKVRAKIFDAESNRDSRSQTDLSAPSVSSLIDTCEKSSVQDIFDSGIQSESNLSSGVISETNLSCSNICDDFRNYSVTFSQGSHDIANSELHCRDYKSEIVDSMRHDSGIDIDLSDSSCRDVAAEIALSSSSTNVCPKETKCKTTVEKILVSEENILWYIFSEPVDDDGNNKLHSAITQGREDTVRKILQFIPASHYLDIRNYHRMTCLHLSVLLNQPNITRLLLLAGAKTGIENRDGNIPLHIACLKNIFECAQALLSPVTAYEQKFTIFKYQPVIDSPHQYINEYNYNGVSCIHLAADCPDMKILHLLFVNGADVNIQECRGGCTILHNAVRTGNYTLLCYILQHSGINLESKNYARLTAYQLSVYNPRIGNILRAKGAQELFKIDDESDEEDDSSDESDDDVASNNSGTGFSFRVTVTDINSHDANDKAIA